MATITKPNTFSAGATIFAAEHNSNFDTIYNDFNGNITNVNIASGAAISDTKLDLGTIAQVMQFNNTVTVASNIAFSDETQDIGTTSIGLNDLHFGSGGIINWDGGDITLTHSAAKLTWGGDGAVEIDFNNHEMTNVDINSGAVDGITLGAAATVTVTDLTMSIGSDADGDTYHRSSNKLTRLAKGTAAQVYSMNSGATVPEWVSPGITLISTTTISNGTDSGDIAIEPSKQYYVTLDIEENGASTVVVDLLFNDSTDASGYSWAGTSVIMNTTTSESFDGDDADNSIPLTGAAGAAIANGEMDATSGYLKGSMYIDTNKTGTRLSAAVQGSFNVAIDGGAVHWCTFSGINIEDLTIADFNIITDNAVNATIKTYELG